MAPTGTLIPARVDLTVIVGADFSTTITFCSDLNQTVPFDLTGYTAVLVIGPASVPLFTLSAGSGITITTPANGIIIVALTHTQTATVTATDTGTGQHYSLKLTDGSGNVSYPLSGFIRFLNP